MSEKQQKKQSLKPETKYIYIYYTRVDSTIQLPRMHCVKTVKNIRKKK